MKKVVLLFALIVGLLASATLQAQVNMSRYITLTVTNGAKIKLDFKAAAANTPVRIVSGSNTEDINVGINWIGRGTYTTGSTTMTVYGDIISFDCSGNFTKVTAIDPSHNTQLMGLNCYHNQLSSLDVSNNTRLTMLNCGNNKLSSLDVSHNTRLEELNCYHNQLSSLDVSNNTRLEELNCYHNQLSSLDVSNNTRLEGLNCYHNQLSSLDVSNNTQLEELYCYDNNFTTATLDDIFCALPDRTGNTNGKIQPIFNSSSPNHATVLATNKTNATAKNWKVQYNNNTDIPTTTGTYVCGTPHPEPNMSRYITLTVAKDSAIRLDFWAAAAGTPVRIVSGSNTQDITVGTSWTGFSSYTADGTTMTVYGDIIGLDCRNNKKNITAINVSHNTQLESLDCSSNQLTTLDISKNTNTKLTTLYCHGNNLSTQALDDIFCALPDRTGNTNGKIQPIFNSSSPNHATVLATNAANATAKNWKVQYYNDDTDIATTGTYVCGSSPQPNMDSYITLTVKSGQAIKLDFKAASAGTPVRIVSGSNTQDITVGTDWKGTAPYTAGSTTMTVYGDLKSFDCSQNGANLTALDPSHNTQLTRLWCGNNNLSNLDVSKNTQLAWLYCYSNKLSSLDLSENTQLRGLFCYGNNFSTAALDDIFCALPVRQASDNARIQPIFNSSSPNHAIVLATNKANAIAKNWKVQYYKNDADIPATTGTYVCGSSPQPNMDSYITLTVAKDSAIRLDFWAAATNTPVRIVSGSNTQDITVGTNWIGRATYTAGSTTMTIYGDLKKFDCSDNRAKITALDVSHSPELEVLLCQGNQLSSLDVSKNMQLRWLGCYDNNFSTQTIDDIYCALPDRTSETNGVIQPVYNSSSSNHATVLATNAANATAKNWNVQYYKNNSDIPATTGKHKCSATDIVEASAEQALTLYPNPVADVLYLSATARTIRVYNVYGIEVAHATDTDRIDVAHLPAGIYTVRADGTVAKMVKR